MELLLIAAFTLFFTSDSTAITTDEDYNPCAERDPDMDAVAWVPGEDGVFMVFYKHWYFKYSLTNNSRTGPVVRVRDLLPFAKTPVRDVSMGRSNYRGRVPSHFNWYLRQVYDLWIRYDGEIYSRVNLTLVNVKNDQQSVRVNESRITSVQQSDCATYRRSLTHANPAFLDRELQIHYTYQSGRMQELEIRRVGGQTKTEQTNQRYLRRVFRDLQPYMSRIRSCRALDLLDNGDFIFVDDQWIYIRHKGNFTVRSKYALFPCEPKTWRKTILFLLFALVASQIVMFLIFCAPFYFDVKAYMEVRGYNF